MVKRFLCVLVSLFNEIFLKLSPFPIFWWLVLDQIEKGLCPWQGLPNTKMTNLIDDGSEQRKELPAWLRADGSVGRFLSSCFWVVPRYLSWFPVRLVFTVRAGFVLHLGPECD